MLFRFDPFELDEARRALEQDGRPVEVQPKVFALILHLVRNRDRVVPRSELLDVLWPSENVTGTSLGRAVHGARRALGASAIETVRGVGFRFVPEVEERELRRSVAHDGLLGREGVLAELSEPLSEVFSGRLGVVLLEGPAGIGKTRILEAFARQAKERLCECLWANGLAPEGAPPYSVWRQLFRAYAQGRSPATLRDALGPTAASLVHAIPEVLDWIPDLDEARFVDPVVRRQQLHLAILRFCRRVCTFRPLVLCVDDLHQADEQTLLILREMAVELSRHPVLIIGSIRSRVAAEQRAALTSLARHAWRVVGVRGLESSHVARILEERFGRSPSPAVVQGVMDRTGGNPLFLHELVAQASRDGEGLERIAGELHLNDSMDTAIARHLEDVGPECRECLETAALLGREFSLAVLAKARHESTATTARLLEEAVEAELLDAGGGFVSRRFVHGLIPEVIARRQATSDRSRRHGAIADALVRLHGSDRDRHAVAIAHHRYESAFLGNAREAWRACRSAARLLLAADAPEEAVLWAERAIEMLDLDADLDAERGRTLLLVAECWTAAADFERARAWLRRCAAIARGIGDAELLGRAAIASAAGGQTGRPDEETIALLREAEAKMPPHQTRLHVALLAKLSDALLFADPPEQATEMARKALNLAQSLGDDTALMEALSSTHTALRGPGGLRERAPLAEAYRVRAGRLGRLEWMINATLLDATDALEAGDRPRLDTLSARLQQQARDLGARKFLFFAEMLEANNRLRRCELAAAAQAIERAAELGRRVQVEATEQYVAAQTFTLYREQGRLRELVDPLRRASDAYPAIPGWRAALALAEWEAGEPEESRRHLRILVDGDLRAIRRDINWHPTLAMLAEVVPEIDEPGWAMALLRELEACCAVSFAGPLFCTYQGAVARHRGRLHAAADRLDEAERLLREAVTQEQRMDAPAFEARALVDLASIARRRNRPGVAHETLARAAAIVGKHDLRGIRNRLDLLSTFL